MNSGFTLEELFPRFWRKVLGSGKDFPLERKVLNVALFASVLVSTFLFFAELAFPLPGPGKILALAAIVLFSAFYIFGRRKQESKWIALLFLFIMYSIILLDWRYIGGINGIALFAIIALTGLVPLILRPKDQFAGFLSVLGVAAIIYILSLILVDEIPHQELSSSYIHNTLISVIVISAGLGLVGLIVINTHRHSRAKIVTLYDSLHDLNETVEERNIKLEIALSENKSLNASLQDMNDRIEERNTTLEIILNKNKVLNKSLIEMNERVEERNARLENALSEIKTLRGIVPICAFCKKIRNDKGYYESVEEYIEKHTHAEFSHGYCPDCVREHFPELSEEPPEA